MKENVEMKPLKVFSVCGNISRGAEEIRRNTKEKKLKPFL